MVAGSLVLLVLPDRRLVFQRRSANARVSPGKLGFFGGHQESGETPWQTIEREIKEETSLEPQDCNLRLAAEFVLPAKRLMRQEDVRFHIFQGEVKSAGFEVFEGEQAETYTREEALKRSDLTPACRYTLENYIKEL